MADAIGLLDEITEKNHVSLMLRLQDDMKIFRKSFFEFMKELPNPAPVGRSNLFEFDLFCMTYFARFLLYNNSPHGTSFLRAVVNHFMAFIECSEEDYMIFIQHNNLNDELLGEKIECYNIEIGEYQKDPNHFFPIYAFLSICKYPFRRAHDIVDNMHTTIPSESFKKSYSKFIDILFLRSTDPDGFKKLKQAEFVKTATHLTGTFLKMYKWDGMTIFIYSVKGNDSSLLDYKNSLGSNYRTEKNGNSLFFSLAFGGDNVIIKKASKTEPYSIDRTNVNMRAREIRSENTGLRMEFEDIDVILSKHFKDDRWLMSHSNPMTLSPERILDLYSHYDMAEEEM